MVVRLMTYKVQAFGLSDMGLVRQNNEDVWGELPEFNFFVIADGMGGHQAGEVASKEAVNTICSYIKKKPQIRLPTTDIKEIQKILQIGIDRVNTHIFKMGRANLDYRGMGTTLCCLLFHPKGLVYAHVGDSRIYRIRGNKIEQLTKDHSLLRELIDQGQLNEQQATDFHYKNIITKAIGTELKVEPTVKISPVQPQDIYMMCTDGLSDLLSLEDMSNIVASHSSIEEAVKKLVESANERGGHDNITVVIAKVDA